MYSNEQPKNTVKIGPHMYQGVRGSNVVLFSYEEPVALIHGNTVFKTTKFWSRTTDRHVRRWFTAQGIPMEDVKEYSQEFFDRFK
jgi:hypothetical protein